MCICLSYDNISADNISACRHDVGASQESGVNFVGESSFYVKIGANIKTYRKFQRMTQQELADRICKSIACISKYEKGDISIDLYTLYEIARALNIPVSLILPQDSDSIPASSLSPVDLPPLFQHSPLYLYTLGTQKSEVVSSVIEIDLKKMEAAAYYAAADLHNYRNCAYILVGTICSSESNIRLYFSNPLLKGDFMLICFRTSDLVAGHYQGAFISLNTMHRFCSSKCCISKTPIRELDGLKTQLSIEKGELYNLKKKNVLFL